MNSWGLYITVSFGSSPQRLIHIHRQINRGHKHPHHPRHRQRTLQDGGIGDWKRWTDLINGCHLAQAAWIWAFAGLCVRVGIRCQWAGWRSMCFSMCVYVYSATLISCMSTPLALVNPFLSFYEMVPQSVCVSQCWLGHWWQCLVVGYITY